MNILTEPKNAIVKQYKKLFRMEGVELEFEEAALQGGGAEGDRTRDRRARAPLDHRGGHARHHVRPPRQTERRLVHDHEGRDPKKKEPVFRYEERKQTAYGQ